MGLRAYIRTVGFTWVIIVSLVAAALGHIDVVPRQSLSKRWEAYTLRIPSETLTPTVKIHVVVPKEFEIEMVEHSEVWAVESIRDERGFIRELTWSGGRIPPQTFAEVKLLARNPAVPGLYKWELTQTYAAGDAAPWTAQTQIIAPDGAGSGGQRTEDAWRASQTATTISFMAMGISVVLILVTLMSVIRSGRSGNGAQDL